MVAARKKPSRFKDWLRTLHSPEQYEAPNQKFVGHRDILIRSQARYRYVAPRVHGVTLDVGCGRGYGFQAIKDQATTQMGIDISLDFLRVAQKTFAAPVFVNANGGSLPFRDNSFDSILAFEVIEHIEDDLAFLKAVKRLARENAFITMSTPNKLAVSGNTEDPTDRFHIREYTANEFYELLSQVFSSVTLLGQYEHSEEATSLDSLINRIPVRWKYLVPTPIQSLLSVTLRSPLQLDECQFDAQSLENAHTFLALCQS